MLLELRLASFELHRVILASYRRPSHLHESGWRIEMNGTAKSCLGNAPAMRNFHWHQQRIAGFEAHALAANLGDELTRQNVEPLILRMVHVERSSTIGKMGLRRKDKHSQPPIRVRGPND